MVGGIACNQSESSILIAWYNGPIRRQDFHIPFWWRHKNRALLVTSFMGKAVCKRRPFATMTKYILYAPFYMWMRWYLFRFVIIIHCKNCYFVLEPMCKCLVWFEVFFLFIWWFFFNALMKYNQFFFRCFFVRFLCLVSLRRGRFFYFWFVKRRFHEWIGLFVGWVVGEFVFFFWFQFFWMELKKKL